MAIELPALSAIIARLADPEIHLAAFGGVVFPIALVIEAPIIMLLAASTALSKDWNSYCKLRRFMMWSGALLTGLHLLVACTPLYYWVVEELIGVPKEIVEPARIGFLIMTPWTWSIAYRRFNQGVLIRFGHSHDISIWTVVRLVTDAVVLVVGYLLHSVSGIVIATSAIAAGVLMEAAYVGYRVQPVLRNSVKKAPVLQIPLTARSFRRFYVPLAMTPLLTLLIQPIGAAALSRMPRPLESLAVWPVVYGLIFIARSLGLAYQEVVVALLDQPKPLKTLRRFTAFLSIGNTLLLLIFVITPLGTFWFVNVMGLSSVLGQLAATGLMFGVLLPVLGVHQNWYQGILVHQHRTRGITESVALFLVSCSLLLWAGVRFGQISGLHLGLAAFTLSGALQVGWVWYRSRIAVRDIAAVS